MPKKTILTASGKPLRPSRELRRNKAQCIQFHAPAEKRHTAPEKHDCARGLKYPLKLGKKRIFVKGTIQAMLQIAVRRIGNDRINRRVGDFFDQIKAVALKNPCSA